MLTGGKERARRKSWLGAWEKFSNVPRHVLCCDPVTHEMLLLRVGYKAMHRERLPMRWEICSSAK